MNRKRGIIISLVILGIVALAAVAIAVVIWLSSNKVVEKKSIQKGVLVNIDTWEVLDQVEVELDGNLTYDSKLSKSLKQYTGKLNIDFVNNKRKDENYTDTKTFMVPLDENDSRCYGTINVDPVENTKYIAYLFPQDNEMNNFMIVYLKSKELDKDEPGVEELAMSNLCIVVSANNAEEAKNFYNAYFNY